MPYEGEVFQAANQADPGFTDIAPALLKLVGAQGTGTIALPGVGAGMLAAAPRLNGDTCPPVSATLLTTGGVAFDLSAVAHHKIYSALLMTTPQQIESFSPKFSVSASGAPPYWCPVSIGAATNAWWTSPAGNLQDGSKIDVDALPLGGIGVGTYVSNWAASGDAGDYGFVFDAKASLPNTPESTGCAMQFQTPTLQLIYF